MKESERNYITTNGTIVKQNELVITKGNHAHMPSRTSAYLPGDERGHICASSLGGSNHPDNVVPQHHDLNHGAWLSLEAGERQTLKEGASISSEKIAYVNKDAETRRPEAFLVNDTVVYPDTGVKENVHYSFLNESNAVQAEWNDSLDAALPEFCDDPNPGDPLRDSMSPKAYEDLMAEVDVEVEKAFPDICSEYSCADFLKHPDSNPEEKNISAKSETAKAQAEAKESGVGVCASMTFPKT